MLMIVILYIFNFDLDKWQKKEKRKNIIKNKNRAKEDEYFALNQQALADDAGITGENNRTAANNACKRIQPKLNKALGIEEGDATGLKQLLDLFVTQRKRMTRRANSNDWLTLRDKLTNQS